MLRLFLWIFSHIPLRCIYLVFKNLGRFKPRFSMESFPTQSPPPPSPPSPNRRVSTLTILSFAVLSLIGILRHEMWRDEVHAWMLVRESSSLVELWQNLQFEAHPALWHLCLYGLNALTDNPLVMQLFHWEIAVVNIILLNCYAPFRRSHKILLSFGYFFFYEYALLSRNYSLSVLFLFLFCAIYASRRLQRSRFYGGALAIALIALANTTAFGLLLSFALAILLAFELWQTQKNLGQRLQSFLLPASLLGVGWGLSLVQITRPLWQTSLSQGDARGEVLLASGAIADVSSGLLPPTLAAILPKNLALEQMGAAKRLAYTLVQIWKAYVPIPPLGETNFWNRNFLVNSELLDVSPSLPLGLGLGILLSGGLFVWSVWRLRRSRLIQILYVTGVGLLYGFSFNFFWWGSQRHHGYLWLLFLACLWLSPTVEWRWPRPDPAQGAAALRPAPPKLWRDGLTWLLVLQSFAGCYFYGMDLRYSFASGKATAEFIQENQLDQLTLVAIEDRSAAAVSTYLNQPLFYPELDRYGTYWTIYEPPSTPEQWAERIEALADRNETDLLLILSEPLDELALPLNHLDALEPITSFESTIDSDESFHLYRYSPPRLLESAVSRCLRLLS